MILPHAAFFWERQVRRCDWWFLKDSSYIPAWFTGLLLAIKLFPWELVLKRVFSVVQSFRYNKSMCSYGESYRPKLYNALSAAICICSFMKRQIKPKELGLKSVIACFYDIFF